MGSESSDNQTTDKEEQNSDSKTESESMSKDNESKGVTIASKHKHVSKDAKHKEVSTESKSKEVSIDSFLDSSKIDNTFRRIASFVFNLSLFAIVLSLLVILISFSNLFWKWLFKGQTYFGPEENWILFNHSVLTICLQFRLRWDVYYCSREQNELSNIDFDFKAFFLLLISDFLIITRIIFVFRPVRGLYPNGNQFSIEIDH